MNLPVGQGSTWEDPVAQYLSCGCIMRVHYAGALCGCIMRVHIGVLGVYIWCLLCSLHTWYAGVLVHRCAYTAMKVCIKGCVYTGVCVHVLRCLNTYPLHIPYISPSPRPFHVPAARANVADKSVPWCTAVAPLEAEEPGIARTARRRKAGAVTV